MQGEVEWALSRVFPTADSLTVAGRTDRGVHALGQVAGVEVGGGPPVDRIAEALNAVLPSDIAVLAAEAAPPDFHARHSARARSYRYRVHRRREPSPFEERRSWWYPRPLDEERLSDAADLLLGKHNFRAFTPTETQYQAFSRTVLEAAWFRCGDALEFEITADSFLRHMVRTLVGSMVELPLGRIAELLRGAERSEAGSTAPPWGLYLERVTY